MAAMAPQGQAKHEHDHQHGLPNSSHTDPRMAATPTSSIATKPWEPYSGVGGYTRHVAVVMAALLTALALALTLKATVRYLVGRRRNRRARLAGAAAECAICLTDFGDGDAVRAMPACRHVFHASCVEPWLAGGRHSSCPTCRAPAAVATAAAAAAQPDEATNRREPYSGAVDYAKNVAIVFLAALMTAFVLTLIEAAVRNLLGGNPAPPQ